MTLTHIFKDSWNNVIYQISIPETFSGLYCIWSVLSFPLYRNGLAGPPHALGRWFASRPGHTKDHHKNGTNCLPAWYTGIR